MHTHTKTQLKKVERGLTKNKHQVSCLQLGYARWWWGHRDGGTQGGLLSFFLPPTPSENPPAKRPELRLFPITYLGQGAGALGDGDAGAEENDQDNPAIPNAPHTPHP